MRAQADSPKHINTWVAKVSSGVGMRADSIGKVADESEKAAIVPALTGGIQSLANVVGDLRTLSTAHPLN
eukprot:1263619-Alexandrium_andersonii.AAC.1